MSSVFISHSSASAAAAARIEQAFKAAGHEAWLDNSDLGLARCCGRADRRDSTDARRPGVVGAGIPVAVGVGRDPHRVPHDRFILPCVTDDALLPQFLIRSTYMDLRTVGEERAAASGARGRESPAHANPLPPRVASASGELKLAYNRLGLMRDSPDR